MAANLVKGGYAVVAYDADGKRAAQFAAKADGAKSAATLADLGKRVDAIVTMLPTGKEVRACLLEAEGGALAAESAERRTRHGHELGRSGRHARNSTPISRTRSLALVDAPVSGGVPRATDGSLAIMIGGDPAAVEGPSPSWQRWARGCSRWAGRATVTP